MNFMRKWGEESWGKVCSVGLAFVVLERSVALVGLDPVVKSVSRGVPYCSRYGQERCFRLLGFRGPDWPNPRIFVLRCVVGDRESILAGMRLKDWIHDYPNCTDPGV